MMSLLEKLVVDGRSTPGSPQANDVPVLWRRFLKEGPERSDVGFRGAKAGNVYSR